MGEGAGRFTAVVCTVHTVPSCTCSVGLYTHIARKQQENRFLIFGKNTKNDRVVIVYIIHLYNGLAKCFSKIIDTQLFVVSGRPSSPPRRACYSTGLQAARRTPIAYAL